MVARLDGADFSEGTVLLDPQNFPVGGGHYKYNLEEGIPNVFRCAKFSGEEFGSLQLREKSLNAYDRLTYEGICAFLALADNSNLIENRQIINSEILRNAKEDMLGVDIEQDDSANCVGAIGEKYKELAIVATYVCDEAYKIKVKAEEDKMAREDNVADTAQTYGAYMNDLKEMLE